MAGRCAPVPVPLNDAVAAVAAGAEQLLPAEVAVDLAERFAHTDRDAAFLAAFAQIDAEAPDGSVGLGLGDQIHVLLGCEKRLLCPMRLYYFLHDDDGQLQEFFQLGVAGGDAYVSEDLLSHFAAVRTECTIWTRVRLRSESNFLRMNMTVVIVEKNAEVTP